MNGDWRDGHVKRRQAERRSMQYDWPRRENWPASIMAGLAVAAIVLTMVML